jgi:hypothetical protein
LSRGIYRFSHFEFPIFVKNIKPTRTNQISDFCGFGEIHKNHRTEWWLFSFFTKIAKKKENGERETCSFFGLVL